MGSVEGCISEADLTQLLLEKLSVSCVATEKVTMSDVYAIADRQRVRGLLWSKQVSAGVYAGEKFDFVLTLFIRMYIFI